MQQVSVSELKARLSRYLRDVRGGSEIQVLDRGKPVARLIAVEAVDAGSVRAQLLATGLVRGGIGRVAEILDSAPLDLGVSLSDVVIEERADRL